MPSRATGSATAAAPSGRSSARSISRRPTGSSCRSPSPRSASSSSVTPATAAPTPRCSRRSSTCSPDRRPRRRAARAAVPAQQPQDAGDRRRALRVREHRADARPPHLRQARRPRPDRGGRPRPRAAPAGAWDPTALTSVDPGPRGRALRNHADRMTPTHAAVPDAAPMTDTTSTSTPSAPDTGAHTTYNVIAVAFDADVNAYAALTKLKELDAQDQIEVHEAVVAQRATDGTLTVKDQVGSPELLGTAGGGLTGLLVGILGGPVGVLIGGSTGLLVGSLLDL